MKIFYFGDLSPGSTARLRARTLGELGHQVTSFDTGNYLNAQSRVFNALRFRYPAGPWSARVNSAFVRCVAESLPELIWVDKGILLKKASLIAARQACGAMLLHYNPDDPFGTSRGCWDVFLDALPEYDVHLVMRDVNVAEYQRAGARRVIRWHWAYDPATHRPLTVTTGDRDSLGGPVGFIGAYEPERAKSILHLTSNNIPVRIWGSQWKNQRIRPALLKIGGREVAADDYARAICAFDISLGFIRKSNRDLTSQRNVEIPACGGFMLAERTDEHLSLFREDKEAVFFSSDAELLDKVRYYLDRPTERRLIAEAGLRRCVTSGYDYASRLRAVLAQTTCHIST
jgi:hypothetical protein